MQPHIFRAKRMKSNTAAAGIRTAGVPVPLFDQSVLNGKAGEFGIVAQVQLLEQSKTVGVDGLDADVVRRSNFPVGVSQGQSA